MFVIHVFNVKLGDSILLETEKDGKHYYSILDCKKIGDGTPAVEFLKQQNIKNIYSIFITHFHKDHCSGLPQLRDYLHEVKGTLEFFISPFLPDEVDFRKRLFSVLYNDVTKPELSVILKAIEDLTKLPSLTNNDNQVQKIRILFEGDLSRSDWKDYIHPGILFAPMHPTPVEAIQHLTSILEKAENESRVINSLSHAFLIKCPDSFKGIISLFTGDLEGAAWEKVESRCKQITNNMISKKIRFVKIPHHGGLNPNMHKSFLDLIAKDTSFVASISCPPGRSTHPSKELLEFLKHNFERCCIACTNIAGYCFNEGFLPKEENIWEQTAKQADFLDFISSDINTTMQAESAESCAGYHTFTVTKKGFNLDRSTGITCVFHPTSCQELF